MSDKEVAGLHVPLSVDPGGVSKGTTAAQDVIEKFTSTSERAFSNWTRNVDKALAGIRGEVATDRLRVIEAAVQRAGGAAALTDPQVQRLGQQIERLGQQTGAVPAGLQAVTERMQKLREEASRAKEAGSLASSLSGQDARRSMDVIAAAIAKVGGTSGVAAGQMEGLKARVRDLVAQGAQVPESLKGMENSVGRLTQVMDAFGRGPAAGVQQMFTSFAPAATAAAGPLLALGAAVVAVAGPVVALGAKFASTGGQLADLSARLAIPTQAIQELSYAAEQSGVDFGTVTSSIEQMQRQLGEAPEKFRDLGLSAAELMKMRPDQQFQAVAEAIRGIQNPTLQAQAAMEVFGRSGAQMLPIIRAGVAGLADEAHRLGFVLGDEQVAAADRLDDALNSLNKAWDGLLVNLGAAVAAAPGLSKGIQEIAEYVGTLSRAAQELNLGQRFLDAIPGLESLAAAFRRDKELLEFLYPAHVGGAAFGQVGGAAYAGPNAKKPQSAAGAKAETEATEAAKKADEERKKSAEQAAKAIEAARKREAEAFAKLTATIKGQNPEAIKQIQDLQKVWSNLSPAEQANSEVVKRVAEAYERLRGQVSPDALPAELEDVRRALQAIQDVPVTEFDRWFQEMEHAQASAAELAAPLGGILAAGGAAPDRDRTGDAQAEEALLKRLVDLGRQRGETEEQIRQKLERQGYSQQAINGALVTTNTATGTWAQTLQNIANQLSSMGSAGGAIGKLLGGFASLGAMFEKGGPLGALFGKEGKGFDLGGIFKGKDGKMGFSSIAQGLTGALAAGMAAFDLGKTIIGMFKKTDAEKAAEQVGRDFGVKISKGLAEQIGKDSKQLGDSVAGGLKNLKAIIDEAGGIAGFGFDKATSKARDLFSMIQTGKLSVKEAGASFDAVFGDLAKHLEQTKGLASAQFLELMKLDAQYGTQSQEVKDYLGRRVDALQGNIDTLLTSGISTQGGATAIGSSLAAAYNQAVAGGASGFDALRDLQPQIDAFEAQLAELGLSGGAAFDQIRSMAALAGDEIAGPQLEKIRAATGAMTELHNMGLLNQEMFSGFTAEIGAAYEALRESGQSGSDAMRLLQPDLQRVWELQQKTGYQVDENTQKLLDEAAAAGLVGEAHMSAQERTATAMDRVADILEKVAEKWGIVIDKTRDFGSTLQDAVNVNAPGGGRSGGGGGWVPPPPPPGYATGGAADFGAESVALLHGREAVIPADRSSGIARDIAGQLAGTINADTTAEIRALRDDMRALMRTLPRAIGDHMQFAGARR